MYEEEKLLLIDTCQWLSTHGYFGSLRGTGGNVSLRVAEGLMVITPSATPYAQLTPEDICLVTLEGNTQEAKKGRKPSIEVFMHAAVYKHRPEINAVVHTHQTYASVLAVLNLSLPALFDEAKVELGTTVEVIPYALSGSSELARQVTNKISNGAFAYIMQNHGALLLGETMEKALLRAELLEKVAHVYCLALNTGKPIYEI